MVDDFYVYRIIAIISCNSNELEVLFINYREIGGPVSNDKHFMRKSKNINLLVKYGLMDFKRYADKHNCIIAGEYHICRVVSNTRHGRKDSVCAVVRAYRKSKEGKVVFGYLIGLKEIEFKPDGSRYVFLEL